MRTHLLNALIQVATFKKTLDEHQTKMFQKKFHDQCMDTVFMLTFSEHYRQQNFPLTSLEECLFITLPQRSQ